MHYLDFLLEILGFGVWFVKVPLLFSEHHISVKCGRVE